MSPRRRTAIVTSLTALLAAAACSPSPQVTSRGASSGASSTTPTTMPAVAPAEWDVCDDKELTDAGVECATVTVPLDYDDPTGTTIDIAIVRRPADGQKIGSLLVNPGGPGGSGIDLVARQFAPLATAQYAAIADRFDIVGFDPRGVDRSNGIHCVDDATVERFAYLDGTPDTPEEEQLLADKQQAFANGCSSAYGPSIVEYDTANTARDMDMIRAAVGDDQLTYYGASYGTYLGAVYATLFPDHVRALVLDSAFDPTGLDEGAQSEIQLTGFEGAFANWVAWCSATTDCAFGSNDVDARWTALRDRLDTTPISGSDGRQVNRDVFVTATIAALYSKSTWPLLAAALGQAEDGDGSGLLTLFDSYSGRQPDGSWDTQVQSGRVISCASGLSLPPPDPAAAAASLIATSPHFGFDATADSFTHDCDGIGEGSQVTLGYHGYAPILVVGGENDPATPIVWAHQLTEKLGAGATLLTYSGEGHGAFFASNCVRAAASDVLIEAQASSVTSCEPDTPASAPSWFGSIPRPGDAAKIDLMGAEEMLGVDPATMYSEAYLSPSATAADDVEQAAGATDWTLLQRMPAGIDGGDDAETLIFLGPDGEQLAVVVLGPVALALPDLAAIRPFLGDAASILLYVAIPT